MKREKAIKELKIDRPLRASVSEKEALKRMKEFSKRKEQFLATARTGKGRSLVSCIILLLLSIQASSQSAKPANGFVGRYEWSFMFGGESVVLNADGTFENDSGSCTITTRETGTYSFVEGAGTFKILKYLGTHPGDENWVDLSDAAARREFFGYKDDEKDFRPRTEFTLHSIKWGDRIYLMNEKALASFVSAINLGLEPRDEGIQPSFYGKFLLREGDEEKPVTGKPSLPSKYLDFLLSEPIFATIVSIEAKENAKERVGTIDKGRLAGVKVGMAFISQDQDPDFCCKYATVLSVDDTSAKVEALDWVVGEALTTKLLRKSRYR